MAGPGRSRHGQIEQVGRPQDVHQRPTSRVTASVVGATNSFAAG
jgi:ABC-type Fe3+/spermidine/putrescine transport system ATPase subunit